MAATVPGFAFAAPYQWLDSDTMAVLARPTLSGDAEVSLLTCRVSTDSCTLAAADVGTADQVVLPDGLPTR